MRPTTSHAYVYTIPQHTEKFTKTSTQPTSKTSSETSTKINTQPTSHPPKNTTLTVITPTVITPSRQWVPRQEAMPRCSKEMLQKWAARSSVFKEYSQQYLNTQANMLYFAELQPEERITRFKELTKNRRWAESTQSTYWNSLFRCLHILGVTPTAAEQHFRRQLDGRAQASIPSNRPALSEAGMTWLWGTQAPMVVPMAVAWSLGQRISDVLLLRKGDVHLQQQNVVLTFRRGKVVRYIGPFVQFVPEKSAIGEAIMKAVSMTTEGGDLLWIERNNEIGRSLLEVGHRDRRCLRRGGLQHMAGLGLSPAELLEFSKHSTLKMLMRYLDHGACIAHTATRQSAVSTAMQERLVIG